MSSSELWVVCKITEGQPGRVQRIEHRTDPSSFLLRVVGVNQLTSVGAQCQIERGKCRGHFVKFVVQLNAQLLLPQLSHQLRFFFDENQFSVVDHTDAISHFLSFFDIVSRENDGDIGIA